MQDYIYICKLFQKKFVQNLVHIVKIIMEQRHLIKYYNSRAKLFFLQFTYFSCHIRTCMWRDFDGTILQEPRARIPLKIMANSFLKLPRDLIKFVSCTFP